MSRRTWNPSAQRTIIQINSTLELLQNKALAVAYNEVPPLSEINSHCQITWYNHAAGRENAGIAFTRLEQYKHILETNSYHCMLFDGSIIRANFEFNNDKLVSQNLLWWPAPYDFSNLMLDGFSPVDILLDLYGDKNWHKTVKMRSPLRIDFDSTNNAENHPHSHIHIQSEKTRMAISRPICFNRFISFVFKNFYPECEIHLSNADFIEYKTPNLQAMEYLTSKLVI